MESAKAAEPTRKAQMEKCHEVLKPPEGPAARKLRATAGCVCPASHEHPSLSSPASGSFPLGCILAVNSHGVGGGGGGREGQR